MAETQYERQHDIPYEYFVRTRITELRMRLVPETSEHKMSLELGKSGSYIRNITSCKALPSLKEFFNILDYLDVTVDEFFAPLKDPASPYVQLCERIRGLDAADIEKLNTFLDWLGK